MIHWSNLSKTKIQCYFFLEIYGPHLNVIFFEIKTIVSSVFKGDQILEPINTFGVKCSVLGNHDLDFGEEKCVELNEKCNFPYESCADADASGLTKSA